MDNNQRHHKSDTGYPSNGVDDDDLTNALFNDLNEPETILPLGSLIPKPHPHSSPLVGQPSSSAGLPSIFETTERYAPPLPLHGERQAHSFSVSSGLPKFESLDSNEFLMQEQSENFFPTGQVRPDEFPSMIGSSGSSGSKCEPNPVLPLTNDVNENQRQSEALTAAVFGSCIPPNPDEISRTFNQADLTDHDQVWKQTGSDGNLFSQNAQDMQGITYSQGYTHRTDNTDGLHAARILQDMLQKSVASIPTASEQQLPLPTLLQQTHQEIGTPEIAAYNPLNENHFDPIPCPTNPHMQTSQPHSSLHTNPLVFPDYNVHIHAPSQNVGNSSIEGGILAGESQLPQRNPSSTINSHRAANSKVLSDVVIDRTMHDNAELLEEVLQKEPCFELFCQSLRENNAASGNISIGGTMRRRPDLIKPIENLTDFGYPSYDVRQVQKILDSIPGVDRHTVEYLKLTVLSQLNRVRQGAREALHQLSAILIDHLRFRIMTQADILDFQCKVVDRFIAARDCILERYSHYVKSRRWIENMSTNQRRGCLTHQQNNIMRMWLYRNFKNPYPDEEEKAYIVEETKLTIEQVNNWLINARSRFWKPAMDYFERETLEIKISVFILHRLRMTPEARVKAVKAIGAASTSRNM